MKRSFAVGGGEMCDRQITDDTRVIRGKRGGSFERSNCVSVIRIYSELEYPDSVQIARCWTVSSHARKPAEFAEH